MTEVVTALALSAIALLLAVLISLPQGRRAPKSPPKNQRKPAPPPSKL